MNAIGLMILGILTGALVVGRAQAGTAAARVEERPAGTHR